MKRSSCPIALSLLFCTTLAPFTAAEAVANDRAIGLQLSVTVEPYDGLKNRFEVNIAPLVYQQKLNDDWQIKLMPLLNLRFDPGRSPVFSHVGFGVSLPHYVDSESAAIEGWYLGPHVNYGYNIQDQNHNVTLAGDVGYSFVFERDLVLTIATEAGFTWFDTLQDDTGNISRNTWRPHFGVKPQLMFSY